MGKTGWMWGIREKKVSVSDKYSSESYGNVNELICV